jgi:nicotinamide riboside kinase
MRPFAHLTGGYVPNKTEHLRLAILGAPGSGKSTLASGLLYFSKLFSFRSDSVPEVAKWHVYKGTDFSPAEFEFQKLREQKELEDIYPPEFDILICEAPLIISAVYSAFYHGNDVAQSIFELAEKEKRRYTHYLVCRKLTRFESFGRHEDEKQAEGLHFKTLEILERLELNYTIINRYDEHIPLQILSMIGAIRKDEEVLRAQEEAAREQRLQGTLIKEEPPRIEMVEMKANKKRIGIA